MRAALSLLAVSALLGGCALGQDIYDERRVQECRELPTPDERRSCERAARDAEMDRSRLEK